MIVHGYRSDALERLGFGDEVRAAARPGLVDVSLDAYGYTGPWAARRGFDSLVQMSSGIADAGHACGGGAEADAAPGSGAGSRHRLSRRGRRPGRASRPCDGRRRNPCSALARAHRTSSSRRHAGSRGLRDSPRRCRPRTTRSRPRGVSRPCSPPRSRSRACGSAGSARRARWGPTPRAGDGVIPLETGRGRAAGYSSESHALASRWRGALPPGPVPATPTNIPQPCRCCLYRASPPTRPAENQCEGAASISLRSPDQRVWNVPGLSTRR